MDIEQSIQLTDKRYKYEKELFIIGTCIESLAGVRLS